MEKKTVKDIEIRGKRVLMRVDFNVPMKDGVVQDETRIKAALPTIKYVLDQGAKSLVLMSPSEYKRIRRAARKEKDGKPFDEANTSRANTKWLQWRSASRYSVRKSGPVLHGAWADAMVKAISRGILMLENTRFHKEEKAKEPAERDIMGKALAQYGDLFVNDAFGSAHRAHASTESVAKFLPAVAGFLMEKELLYLEEKVVKNPARPFVALIGGAKISSKIAVLESLLSKVDRLIVGGGMAYTFLKAKGLSIGNSLIEEDMIDTAHKILQKAYESHLSLPPIDHIVTKEFAADAAEACRAW